MSGQPSVPYPPVAAASGQDDYYYDDDPGADEPDPAREREDALYALQGRADEHLRDATLFDDALRVGFTLRRMLYTAYVVFAIIFIIVSIIHNNDKSSHLMRGRKGFEVKVRGDWFDVARWLFTAALLIDVLTYLAYLAARRSRVVMYVTMYKLGVTAAFYVLWLVILWASYADCNQCDDWANRCNDDDWCRACDGPTAGQRCVYEPAPLDRLETSELDPHPDFVRTLWISHVLAALFAAMQGLAVYDWWTYFGWTADDRNKRKAE